jgi:hypothetical protein
MITLLLGPALLASVLANRLSENTGMKVLILEADRIAVRRSASPDERRRLRRCACMHGNE